MHKNVIYPCGASGSLCVRYFFTLTITLILTSNFLTAFAYNIDTNYPILYPHNASNAHQYQRTSFERSYFGYSVLLHRDSRLNITWLYVGAPRGNYTNPSNFQLSQVNEPGVVYRCAFFGSCTEIEPAVVHDENILLPQFFLRGRVHKEHSWFGSAMSIDKNTDFLTVCAPRAILSIITEYTNIDTIQGMCYSKQMPSTKVEAETMDIKDHGMQLYDSNLFWWNFRKDWWHHPMTGFSVQFAPTRNDSATISRIVSKPVDEIIGTVIMVRLAKRNFKEVYRKNTDIDIHDNLSRLGYSITSGYYFNRKRFLYVVGDPCYNYNGQVAAIDPDARTHMIANLHGSETGEYFGASLASGDLNNDGLDDLVVGAPHWKNDNGRVHIFLGTSKGQFETSVILEGAIDDSLFGYTVACGDLDADGYSDIIVSAPWEESGAIYVYNGDASLNNKITPVASQRITMESPARNFPAKLNILTFGFSISEPVDIDNNGYADIAVGAYKSGHAVVLRSKPVVTTNLIVRTTPDTLQRNVSSFSIQVCVEYHGYDLARSHAFKISLSVDARYKRTKQTSLELFSMDPPVNACVDTNVTLSENIQDFIEPITIYAFHNFTHDSSAPDFCKTCPVEKRSGKPKGAQALLPFDIGCGEDRVCNSNITASIKLSGIRNNDKWVIGSNDITLEIHLENHGEPSYLTIVAFTLPYGIVLRSILPSCEEYSLEDALVIACDAGNPLGINEQKVVKLDLDMRYLTDGSLHGRTLEFPAEIRTRSVNRGEREIKAFLTLQSEAYLLLNGKANEESYYFSDLDKEQLNMSFQHTYQILKFGATPIKEAQLFVNIPTSVDDTGSLIFLYKPKIYLAGEYHDCLSEGVQLVDVQSNEQTSDLDVHMFNNKTMFTNETQHRLFKRDLNSHTNIMARFMQALYSTTTNSANLNDTSKSLIYLNCSTPGVNCSMISCDLSALKTEQDIGKLVVRLILNATKLKDTFDLSDETKIVKYSTEAYVRIIQPADRIFSADDIRRNMSLTTEFHGTAKTQKLQLWVVLVSVSLGIILLVIVIIILSTTGFFKRKTKEEWSALKADEVTEDMDKTDITNMIQ